METKHSERSHAKLSASSSARWLAGPPSAMLNAKVADTASDFAREGTCAHELAEYKVNKLLGHNVRDPTENLDFFDGEMAECTDSYVQYIAEETAKYHQPVVMVEQRLDFSSYVPDGFGTGDCIIVADEVLTVIDFKYGKNVLVSAESNSQMMLYDIGSAKLKGNSRSIPPLSAIKTPLRDGDIEKPDDEAYANSYFLNANSTTAPGIVDADRQPILDRSEVYSGCYGRVSITFYAFNSNGNKGIACGLNNLQKIRDGEPLDGHTRAEDDFADDDDDFLD